MTAEKIVKINNDYELKALNERLSVYESVIEYSVAEQILSLKNKVKDLENEAIALRATDAEKDKMIEEKDNQLAYIREHFDTQLNGRLEWQRKQFEAEKNQSLIDQRKNIRSREVKPEKEKVEQAKQEVNRIQKMYESLICELNISHDNEKTMLTEIRHLTEISDTLLSLCNSKFTVIIGLLNNGATKEEVVSCINEAKETVAQARIRKECIQIHEYILGGYSISEIASILYPNIERRIQKVSERMSSAIYQQMFYSHG